MMHHGAERPGSNPGRLRFLRTVLQPYLRFSIIHTQTAFTTPINTRIVDNLVDKVEKERG